MRTLRDQGNRLEGSGYLSDECFEVGEVPSGEHPAFFEAGGGGNLTHEVHGRSMAMCLTTAIFFGAVTCAEAGEVVVKGDVDDSWSRVSTPQWARTARRDRRRR